MSEEPKRLIDALRNPTVLLKLLRDYVGLARSRRLPPITDKTGLQDFLNTRASFVAQVSLYGYLRTRAGMRYPELFDDDPFVVSINIAKWQIWLACLSDLAVYAGGLLMQHSRATEHDVSDLIQQSVNAILEEIGIPADAGSEFTEGAKKVQRRLQHVHWRDVSDDEAPFTESPQALVEWAPIVKDLKELDEEIVINSVRFRWQKVRQDLRRALNAGRLLGFED